MKKAILVAVIGAMTLGVNAGDWGKAPVGKAPIEECIDLGGVINVGWMSDYFYAGYHLTTSTVHGGVNYTFDGLAVPITIGAQYFNSVDRPTFGVSADTLQLSAAADLGTIAGFDLELAYTQHLFPEGLNPVFNEPAFPYGDTIAEVSLRFRRDLGFATLVGSANYLPGETDPANPATGGVAADVGFYGNVGLERAFGITDNISLVLSGGAGYVDMFGTSRLAQRGWNHYYVQASLPIQLNCRTTLTPYIGLNEQPSFIANNNPVNFAGFPPTPADGSVVHGGVALSVSF